MTRPRPVPPYLPGDGSVGLHERLEQLRLRLGRHADAGVGDLEAQEDAVRTGLVDCATRTMISPAAVNLTALPSRLVSTCRTRPGSPSTVCGHVVMHEVHEVDALATRPLFEEIGGLLNQQPDVERLGVQLHLARLRSSTGRECR